MSLEPIPGYDSWKTATGPAEHEHVKSCPQHPDALEVYECGGKGGHLCSPAERLENDCDQIEPTCGCPTKADLKAEAAEARADAREDR